MISYLSQIRAIARVTVLEARRNRLPWLVGFILVAAVAIAGFLAQVAITETRQIQAAFLGSALRWASMIIVSLFVITSMVREFNDKGFEWVLSFSVPRAGYFLGKLLGYGMVAVGVALAISLPLWLFAPAAQVLAWTVSLGCELMIVTAASMVCLLTFKQVTPAFIAVAGFYILARCVGALHLLGRDPMLDPDNLAQRTMSLFVDFMGYLLPSLDQFTSTEWLVYHSAVPASLGPVVIQSVVYIVLLGGVGLVDLYRKNL